jgi:hypothetical protein
MKGRIVLLMSNAAITVLEETVYSDGSGVAGTYEVYGVRLSGLHSGESCTVTPLGIPTSHRGGRSKGIVRSAIRIIEGRLMALMAA